MAANISSITCPPVCLRLSNDVRARTLHEPTAYVLVVAHERLGENPYGLLGPGHRFENLAGGRVQVHAVAVSVLDERAGNRPEVGFGIDVLPAHLQEFPSPLCGGEPKAKPGAHVRILSHACPPDATDLVVRQDTVARRL